jgi:tRNA A-37 threonylcarbamoyl transferase component Bud32
MSFNYKLLIRDCKRKRAKDLDLSAQEISIIPDETFSLTFVKTLNLANNGLTGLDDRVAFLADLEVVDLRNNLFTKFPFVLLKLPRLKTLHLSGNQFSDEFSFLNSVGDNLDDYRGRLRSLHDQSQKSFKDDFFSDDDFEPISQVKTQTGFLPKQQTESRTASPTSDSYVQSLQDQIQKLSFELQSLQSQQLTRLKSQVMGESGSDLPLEIQIKSPSEVKSTEKLSQGGFSIIERGVFKGTTVAIKHFFDPSKLSEVKEEFLNEVRMLNKLRHPNIITLIGYHLPSNGSDNFLVFEFLPKGNLYEALHVKRIKFDKKAFLLKLAEVMHFIHLSNVCHRDLKSLNIMITGDGSPKLIDFGLARNFEDLNRGTNKFAATAAYSAPELFIQKELTQKVDVYAFGVLMWEVLNEDVPFRSMPMGDIRKFVLDKNVLSCKGLSTAYAEVVQKCCAFNPETRPNFAEIIKMIERIPN